MKKNVVSIVCVICLASVLAWAERPVHETSAAAPDGTVEVSNIAGLIEIEGWDRGEVELTGNLADSIEKVEFEVIGDHTRIEVKYPRNSKEPSHADLKVMVPAGSSVEIEAVSADVTVSRVLGELDLESVSGDVKVFGTPAEIDAASVSGDVIVEFATDQVELASVSGDILVREVRGELEAESVSGKIAVESGLLSGGAFETVSGSIVLEVELDRGHLELESMSGNLTLAVPHSTVADFEVETFSGSIDNRLTGDQSIRTSKHTPGSELEFSTGSGGSRVSISSFSGSVTIGG
ncbi:MAG: DUF4097 family beta strand repeat-containing protein [Acidobacteriota bacterium]